MKETKLMETLGILQEEAAEVIQAVSKYRRFGDNGNNRLNLEQEIGDFLCLVVLLEEQGFISDTGIELAMSRKLEKLKKYSNIVGDLL
jgi:NTP pyrophosphatase (non-canonical NTP hydrolase)